MEAIESKFWLRHTKDDNEYERWKYTNVRSQDTFVTRKRTAKLHLFFSF